LVIKVTFLVIIQAGEVETAGLYMMARQGDHLPQAWPKKGGNPLSDSIRLYPLTWSW